MKNKTLWLLPILAIVGGMLVNYFYSSATLSRIGRLGQTDYPALAASQALIVDLDAIEDVYKNAVSAAEKEGLQQAATKAAAFRKDLGTLAALPDMAQPAQEIGASFDAYFKAADLAASIMLQVKEGDVATAAAAMQAGLKATSAKLQAQREQAAATFDAGLQASRDYVGRSLIANIVGAVVVLLVSLAVSRWSVQRVLKQLGGDPEYAKKVVQRVADGDLATAVHARSGDSGSLLAAMRAMQDKLGHVIAEVRSSVSSIGVAADEITSGYNDLSSRTHLQASRLEESTQSLVQLSATVKRNADTAVTANRLAGDAAQVAGEGGKVVGDVVATMQAINDSSKKITDIISVIDSIAFQTNILALNAAVEAARAGEQGRGFAVVASEVRSLAQRSAAAAREIKTLIDDSVGKVDAGSQQVRTAGATMAQIVSSVSKVRDLINEIATASAEQSEGFELINKAIGDLDGVAQQNAALVEQAAAATTSLQRLALSVTESVGVFRLSGDVAASQPQPESADTEARASATEADLSVGA